ncbi:uncharacterized protein LOC113233179 [Hyposmocoma kahamanoa]|uniref:uncharacterized protein LOC113233179 n=1 Tax=Hyposmocoma kahamanoa TaxID=1477025 RepID=UPI000E6D5C9F|nr:uncharacterized protein LOC113233179 [Hyposmocoma kahamanoa]
MIRKVVLGTGLLAFVPQVRAATPVDDQPEPHKPPPMRPSDLPYYDSPHAQYGEFVESKAKQKNDSYIRRVLLEPVKSTREQVQSVFKHTDGIKNTVMDNYKEFKDRTDWIVKYLQEEENKEVRYGAVVMGGLTGFIFGLRGGFFRRIIYTSVGTTAMGAVCFPEETSQLAAKNGVLAKQYINIAYNFFYGVKPGDPQLEVKFPELSFPKDFSGFVDLTVSMASSIKQALMPPPTKEEAESKPEKKE